MKYLMAWRFAENALCSLAVAAQLDARGSALVSDNDHGNPHEHSWQSADHLGTVLGTARS
jgi:hypothetical protein